MTMHWSTLELFREGQPLDAAERVEALREWRETDSIDGVFFAPLAGQEDMDPSEYGPELDAIDWTGFLAVEADESLCDRCGCPLAERARPALLGARERCHRLPWCRLGVHLARQGASHRDVHLCTDCCPHGE